MSDVHDAARIDPEQVAVIGEVMDRAQCESIDDGRVPVLVPVFNDVRGLDELGLAQGAHGAALAVRVQDVDAEALLMQSDERLARRVAPYVLTGHEAL